MWLAKDGRIILDLDETTEASHVTVQEAGESDFEIDLTKALEALEDGGQATVDELKELNLRFVKEPRPVYMSVMLMPKEEENISSSSLNTRMCLHRVLRKCLD